MSASVSALQKARAEYEMKLPPSLENGAWVTVVEGAATESVADQKKVKALFPNTYGLPRLTFKAGGSGDSKPITVGVVLSGGQAPGGHNVIAGLFDGVKSIHADSKLYGFIGGPSGLIENKTLELTADIIDNYRNTGGFDIIGSGRTKLETAEQFEESRKTCEKLGVQAVVIIGGDDSNTNACLLAEYYKANDVPIQVVGCPKTIDGDLKNEQIETSFGFDTACRVYSELIGNIQRDANSACKYWHFVRLMGRSASHIALECALQTHPNLTFIGEEVLAKKLTLSELVDILCDTICARAEKGLNYGVALVPEGIIEFIPEMKSLIAELNDILAEHKEAFEAFRSTAHRIDFVIEKLSAVAAKTYSTLPQEIQTQLIFDRDPHGNVQVSRIETEKLLVEMVTIHLRERKVTGKYKGKFSSHTHFFGYEGRCAAPSNFDANYCYALGYSAAALLGAGWTGYMASVSNLSEPVSKWVAGGVPITMMMNIERRHGADKPVIQKALVNLDGAPFHELARHRKAWAVGNDYVYPGPIQYFGPSEVCDVVSKTLELESKAKSKN